MADDRADGVADYAASDETVDHGACDRAVAGELSHGAEADAVRVVRDGYRAVGLGIGDAMLRLFGQGSAGSAAWAVVDLVSGGRARARELAAEDLFGCVPGHWEVTRVEPRAVVSCEQRVVATGHVLCRPRGVRSFDLCRMPFAHVWTLCRGQAVSVVSYLDGVELRRLSRVPGRRDCPPPRRTGRPPGCV